MEILIRILSKAYENNLQYTLLMCVIIAFLFCANIILGTILGTTKDQFNAKKFFFGIMKAIIVIIIIVGVCYTLNVFTLVLSEINGITISDEVVNSMSLLLILFTEGSDLAKEVLSKIKDFREIKYDSENDFKIVNDIDVIEPSDQRG